MAHIPDIAQYDLPMAALIDALASDAASVAEPGLVARLRDLRRKSRAAFAKQSDDLDKLYEEAAQGDADPVHLEQIAEAVLERERAKAERLRPQMAALEEKLARHGDKLDPGVRECFQEILDIAVGSLELYKTLRNRLLALSANRRSGPEGLLRARPIAGTIDHEALSREFMARFPKIRAALAK